MLGLWPLLPHALAPHAGVRTPHALTPHAGTLALHASTPHAEASAPTTPCLDPSCWGLYPSWVDPSC
eukprot:7693101-Pyramimonas_sp.AAC.1